MKDVLLLDGDMLIHRSTVAVEKDTRFLDRYHILFSDAEAAWNVLMDTLFDLQHLSGTSEVLITLSDPDRNFRKGLVGDDYKSHRAGTRKPLAYWDTRKRVEDTFATIMMPTLEADDVMGILMTREGGEKFILWSLDKDLKQIPGRHLKDDEVYTITEQMGTFFFYQQALAGDMTDGYAGCPGIGMDTASRLLINRVKYAPFEHEMTRGPRKGQCETRWAEVPSDSDWDTVLSGYAKAGLGPMDALYNAQMARILRDVDYPGGKIKLWKPNA